MKKERILVFSFADTLGFFSSYGLLQYSEQLCLFSVEAFLALSNTLKQFMFVFC